MRNEPQYIFDANEKQSLALLQVPLVVATPESTRGYGSLVDDPKACDIEVVRWPAQGWRAVDEGTGDQGGTVEGVFHAAWSGDVLMGRNEAVNGEYVLGWSCDPQQASIQEVTTERDRVLLWHMNYHPDGGQLFYPWTSLPSSSLWRFPAMTSNRRRSSPCGVTVARGSTFTLISGMKVFSRLRISSGFLIGRGVFTPG